MSDVSEVLYNRFKNAKLAGTTSPSFVPMTYGYLFRDNEQAATIATRIVEDLISEGILLVKETNDTDSGTPGSLPSAEAVT